ncbi:MAG: hypothetical protein J07HR59_00282 [Halorubrum sp. J07HR59]|nr:MAG: hypothetical protein J07HR59_00282 [Halorubrum sp. J07HR59]
MDCAITHCSDSARAVGMGEPAAGSQPTCVLHCRCDPYSVVYGPPMNSGRYSRLVRSVTLLISVT